MNRYIKVKQGEGFNIAYRHNYSFRNRFEEENAKAIAEAREEQARIKQQKTKPKTVKEEHQVAPQSEGSACLLCDGKLFIRNGKFGLFLGCSNYPTCRFTCQPKTSDKRKFQGKKTRRGKKKKYTKVNGKRVLKKKHDPSWHKKVEEAMTAHLEEKKKRQRAIQKAKRELEKLDDLSWIK